MKKYKSVIEKVVVSDATFKNSTVNSFEPTWINYFYGNNGTGKSTIARTIKALTGLTWNSGGGRSESDYVIRVFSRDFISEELKFNDDDPTMPGVITLGEEYINAQQEVDAKIAERNKLIAKIEMDNIELEKSRFSRDTKKTKFEEDLWKTKGQDLKKIFGGSGDFRSKGLFANRIRAVKPVKHSYEDIISRYKTATDSATQPQDTFDSLDLSKLHNVENFSLLAESIISTADNQFSRFMQSLDATAWVKDGYDEYLPKSDGKCPFCQQSMTGLDKKDITMQIAECFDGKFTEDCAKLAKYQQKYADYASAFVATTERYIAFLKENPNFGNLAEYEKNLALLEKVVSENNHRIAGKVSKPSETITLETMRPHLEATNALIEASNALIFKNNVICRDREKEVTTCFSELWEILAFDLQGSIQHYVAEDKALVDSINTLIESARKKQETLKIIKGEITKLSEKLGGSMATLQKVNDLLEKTGFRGFSLKEHETVPNRYRIIRDDGSVATKLSEGERNFIAFLYFYYLVQGSWKREDLLKGKIVIIDDPVSSMDSGALSIVGSLVLDLINDCFLDGVNYKIGQIFVLTHNPYFHNAVSQTMLRPDECYYKKVAFYEVKKSEDNISTISEPCIHKSSSKDPDITHENVTPVQNSYSALWHEYKDAKLPSTLLHLIHRIVETHFVLICSYAREDLRKQALEFVGSDISKQKLIQEILLNIHDSIAIDDSMGEMIYFPAPSSVSDYKDAFRDVFKAMGQEPHYAKMSGEGKV